MAAASAASSSTRQYALIALSCWAIRDSTAAVASTGDNSPEV
ncbi:Uncharacterised protein [Mycobacteroides abscessus subsp. abscessus]|nr:Uncharacterised protein [Mycobacteroides abscessus subsp. abscessus]